MKNGKKIGYVYILSNTTMPGIVKIGKTTRDPIVRLKEINSATGVAMPFKIEAVVETKNPSLTESMIHKRLSRNRVNQRREFFRISVSEATDVARSAANKSKAKIYSGRRYRRPNDMHFYARLVSAAALSAWAAVYGPTIAIATFILCLWSIMTKSPRTLWEALSAPAHFGKIGMWIAVTIAIYPLAIGLVNVEMFSLENLNKDYLRAITTAIK